MENSRPNRRLKSLPALTLASSDESSKVAAFYKEKLKDWKYKNQMGMFDVFWKGNDDYNFMNVAQAATAPNVVVMVASSVQTDFMPDAKTAIALVYKPLPSFSLKPNTQREKVDFDMKNRPLFSSFAIRRDLFHHAIFRPRFLSQTTVPVTILLEENCISCLGEEPMD